MTIDWRGARVLITGAGSGIGRALAHALGDRGARLAVCDIEATAAEGVAAELRAKGTDARSYGVDVADAAAMQALAEQVGADLGGLEALFNNAGVGGGGARGAVSPPPPPGGGARHQRGGGNRGRAGAPMLEDAANAGRPAWIVNTGSEHSLGIPGLGASNLYTASKHALLGLTDVIRSDLRAAGVQAALLCPGLVATNIFDARRNRPDAFGGAQVMGNEMRARMQGVFSRAQDPAVTARICLEGLDAGEFVIITDPMVRPFVEARISELQAAVDQVEARFTGVAK